MLTSIAGENISIEMKKISFSRHLLQVLKQKKLIDLNISFFRCTTNDKCPYYGSPLGFVRYSNECISITNVTPSSLPLSETKIQKVCINMNVMAAPKIMQESIYENKVCIRHADPRI